MSVETTHLRPSQTRNRKSVGRNARHGRIVAVGVALLLSLSMALAHTAVGDEGSSIAFSPQSGQAGTYVWVTGSEFTQDDEIHLGGIEIDHDYYSEERLGFTVPDIAPADYLIAVINDDGNRSVCCFQVLGEDNGGNGPGNEPGNEPGNDPGTGSTGNTMTGQSSGSCRESGLNVECNEFGTIKMKAREDIRGETVHLGAEIWLNSNYEDRGARHIMFSIRNVTAGGTSPVVLDLTGFRTDVGEIVTTKVDKQGRYEINLWVDVLDTPARTPIYLEVEVGVTDRGAFLLETVVIPFDRGYEPIRGSGGTDISLYSFTLLGVNQETSSGFGGRLGAIPGPATPLVLAAFALAALAWNRREAL